MGGGVESGWGFPAVTEKRLVQHASAQSHEEPARETVSNPEQE